MPVPGLYWADAASIGPVQARFWQLMTFLQEYGFQTIRGCLTFQAKDSKNFLNARLRSKYNIEKHK